MTSLIVPIIILIPFLIFGIVLSKGKGAFLIAGYNTLPDDEKAKYDEAALAKFMGKTMFGYCFGIFLLGLNEVVQQQWLFILGLLLIIGLTIFTFVYTNTNNRFKK